MVETALELAGAMIGEPPLRCADLGTGSGAIGLSLAFEMPRGTVEVWLTDVSADALDVARANAAGLGIAGAGVRFGHGSWFAALPAELKGTFGIIVSNPPYIATGDPEVDAVVHQWEPAGALYAGADGLDAVRAIGEGASSGSPPVVVWCSRSVPARGGQPSTCWPRPDLPMSR